MGSLDPRRSPSPTKQPSRISPQNLQRTSPSSPNVGLNPPVVNQPQRNLSPHLHVVNEVSNCEKTSSPENVLVHREDNPKLSPIPNIKLIITSSDKSRIYINGDQIGSGIASSVSTPESEPSTHYTDTSNGNETPEMRSLDSKENKVM